jgi:ligand-binding sensor domain-containing protein
MKYIFGIIVFLSANLSISAQQYYFKQYSTQQGLPQSEVFSMLEDKQGSIWAATHGGGLARLAGEKFAIFTKKDGLLQNRIVSLGKDSQDNIWIGYINGGGLSKYDGIKFTHYQYQDSALTQNGYFPFSILEDRYTNIWVTVFDQTVGQIILFLKKDDAFVNYNKKDTLVSTNHGLFNVILDKNKNVTWSNNQGIQVFNGKEFETKKVIKSNFITNKNLVFIYQDSKEIEWYLTFDGQNPIEVFQYDGNQFIPFKLPSELSLPNNINNGTLQMLEDKQGLYWFSIRGVGILKYNSENKSQQFTLYNEEKGFPISIGILNGMLSDRENNIWIGSRGGGMVKFLDGDFINFTKKDGLSEEFVRGLYQDSKGDIWIGTSSNGVCKYDGEKITAFPITNDPNFGMVRGFIEDEFGNIIVVTRTGLRRLDLKSNTYNSVNKEFGLLEGIGFLCVFEEGDNIWLLSNGQGIFCYNRTSRKIITKLTTNEGLNSNSTTDIEKDATGNYWIATRNGVNKFDGKKVDNFKNIPIMSDGSILDICIDKNDNIWFIDFSSGLYMFDGKKTTFYDKSDGLAANLNYSLTIDHEGDIWIGTQQGVTELTIDENSQVIKIRNYNKTDGLLGDEMNDRALIVDTQNNVWMGHIEGLSRYSPNSSTKTQISSPITQLTKVTPYLKDINWKDSLNLQYYDSLSRWNQLPQNLILPYEKNSLSFQFASSSRTIPEKVRYQWKLEPLDDFWVSVTDKTQADYTNLSAGDYTFHVRSMNHVNSWGEPTKYSFTVKPPIWKTWWFLTLSLTALSSLIFLAVWARLRVVEAQKKELEALVDKRTEEVVKQKNQILEKNSELEEQKADIIEKNTELEQQQEEIMSQNEEMEIQSSQLSLVNQKISEKNRNITASINYAKRIQDAMLPVVENIQANLPDSFVFYRPRDIVSGDFYWFYEKDNQLIIAAADCTGHGVPGAFMSLVASNLMHNAIVHKGIMEPEKILSKLHRSTYSYLKQGQTRNQDGMDIALCHIDKETRVLTFAGAKNPLVYSQNNKQEVIKGTRYSIGGYSKFSDANVHFQQHKIELSQEPSTFYIYTDGFQDQFGGEKGGKFRTGPFRKLLADISKEPIDKQEGLLAKVFDDWKGREKQIDDVLVIGFKI